MADINEILLRITGDDDDAKRMLEALIAAMEGVDKLKAEPEVELKGEEETLTGLAKSWAELQALGAAKAEPEVEVKGVPQGITEMAILAAALEALPNNVDVDVQVDRTHAGTEALGALSKIGNAASGAVGGLGSALSQVGVSLGPFAVALNPVTAAVLLLVVAIGTALVGALAALAASAALAAAALAALAVGLAAALAPIALIGIPALLSFAKVLKVLKAEQTDAGNAAQEKARADQQAAVYSRQHADASRALSQAVQAEKTAVVSAMREMQDAIEAVSDSFRSLERAKLSEERAKLNVKKAEADLKGFRKEVGALGTNFDGLFKKFTDVDFKGATSGIVGALKGAGVKLSGGSALDLQDKVLALKEARQSEKEATDGVSDAERTLTRARQDALKFQKQGIAASDTYRAAQERVRAATENLARVEADRIAQLKQAKLTESVSQTEALNSTEKDLLQTTKEIIAAFKEAFGPGIQAFIQGVTDGIKKIGPTLKGFKGQLTDLGGAMGKAVGDALGILATPEFANMFSAWIDAATILAPLISTIFVSLFDLLGKIGTAALPFVVAGFQAISDWLSALSENTSVKDISDILAIIVPHLQTWLDVAKQLGIAFFGLIIAIAPYGQQLADWIAKAGAELADWVKSDEGRQQIKDFFEKAVPAAEGFVTSVVAIVTVLGRLSTIIISIVQFFVKAWTAIDNFLQRLDEGQKVVEDWINNAAQKLNDWLVQLPGKILSFIKDARQAAVDLGINIIHGIVDGIKSAPDAIKDALMDAVGGAWDAAKGFLHIGSPSKLFFDMGQQVTRGFELGIQHGADRVAKATGRMTAVPVVVGPNGSTGGMTIQRQILNLPPAPGHDQLGDPRVQAEMFAREMARRGQGVM